MTKGTWSSQYIQFKKAFEKTHIPLVQNILNKSKIDDNILNLIKKPTDNIMCNSKRLNIAPLKSEKR